MNDKREVNMSIKVIDKSHGYSMNLRFTHTNGVVRLRWFDIVDNTELNF